MPFVPHSRHQLREFALRSHVHVCLLLGERFEVFGVLQDEICVHRGFFVNSEFQSASENINIITELNEPLKNLDRTNIHKQEVHGTMATKMIIILALHNNLKNLQLKFVYILRLNIGYNFAHSFQGAILKPERFSALRIAP